MHDSEKIIHMLCRITDNAPMATINDIFRAALNKELENKWGGQTALAKETGFSLSKIHSLTTGARKSDEETTRLVAEKLGYPGRRYEDFLDIARQARRGLWRDDQPVPPWVWRRGEE